MRDIKFRYIFKHFRTGEVRTKIIDIREMEENLWGDIREWEEDGFHFEHRDQYTGLKDQNGKEIYEGDVDGEKDSEYGYRHVAYKDGAYGLQYGDDESSFDPFILWDRVEVIGKIHDNPELLTGGKADD